MKRLSVSQIAWNEVDEPAVLELLRSLNISNIEVAPGILFENPTSVSEREVKQTRDLWNRRGFSLGAMQGLMFGRGDLQLFGENKEGFIEYLSSIIRLAGGLGVGPMVFGCPKNRSIPEGHSRGECLDVFRQLGEIAEQNNTYFCIEPNAREYGTNFINNVDEAIDLVMDVDHPHFKMILDTSTIILNNDNILDAIERASQHFVHFHISAPMLMPISELQVDHEKIAQQLNDVDYKGIVSVEMAANKNTNGLYELDRCLTPIADTYGEILKGFSYN
jgi:D-psicose/D-tagatose/L-ribulose 3-epimerase